MAENPANQGDIEARWRPLTDQEVVNTLSLLTAAWARLQMRAPAVASYTPGTIGEQLIRDVIVTAVVRVLKNPDNAKSETIDDYSFTRPDGVAYGDIYFSDDDIALLNGVTVRRSASLSMDSWA